MRDTSPDERRVCTHLPGASPWVRTWRWYTGAGLTAELLCQACRDARLDGRPVALVGVPDEAWERIAEDVADILGIGGAPEVLVRDREVPAVVEVPLPAAPLDLAPIEGVVGSRWMLLLADGQLVEFDADGGAPLPRGRVALPTEPDEPPWNGRARRRRLHVSRGGRFAAVVTDYGRYGVVADLSRDVTTMHLDGGRYHPETVPFSLAFFDDEGATRLVHRTDWNRLDVSDPATGALLTAREPTAYERGEPRPPHYLDYFHGRLHLCPSGRGVLDDGWVWHPVGVPRVFDLRRWLDEDPWEAEHARRPPCFRADWDHGMCWLSPSRFAIGGLADDDEQGPAGVSVYEVDAVGQVRRVTAFAGPDGELFGDGDRLYAAGTDELTLWDVPSGTRVGRVPGFTPTCWRRTTRELAEIRGGALRRLRLP